MNIHQIRSAIVKEPKVFKLNDKSNQSTQGSLLEYLEGFLSRARSLNESNIDSSFHSDTPEFFKSLVQEDDDDFGELLSEIQYKKFQSWIETITWYVDESQNLRSKGVNDINNDLFDDYAKDLASLHIDQCETHINSKLDGAYDYSFLQVMVHNLEICVNWIRWQMHIPDSSTPNNSKTGGGGKKDDSAEGETVSSGSSDASSEKNSFRKIVKFTGRCQQLIYHIVDIKLIETCRALTCTEIENSKLSDLTLNFLRILRVMTLFYEVESHVTLALNYQVKIKYDGVKSNELASTLIETIQSLRTSIGKIAPELSISNLKNSSRVTEDSGPQRSSHPEFNFINYLLVEMEAICLTSDILVSCETSPLTCQKFVKRLTQTNKKRSQAHDLDENEMKNETDNVSVISGSETISTMKSEISAIYSIGATVIPSLYISESTSDKRNHCKVATLLISYSVTVFRQLSQSSMLRSKLCFAFYKYLQILNSGLHLWQNGPLTSIHTEFDITNIFLTIFQCDDQSKLLMAIIFQAAMDMFPITDKVASNVEEINAVWFKKPLILDLQHWIVLAGPEVQGARPMPDVQVLFTNHEEILSSLRTASNHSPNLPGIELIADVIILRDFSTEISTVFPKLSIFVMELHLELLTKRNNNRIIYKVQKQLMQNAAQAHDPHRTIKYGMTVLRNLASDEINAIAFVAETLVSSFTELGLFEQAVAVLKYAFLIIENGHQTFASRTNPNNPANSNAPSTTNDIGMGFLLPPQRQIHSDALRFKLAQLYLNMAQPHKAALELQTLLCCVSLRPTLNAKLKISLLSWLVQAYLDMESPELCKKIIASLKSIRVASTMPANKDTNPTSPTSSSSKKPGGGHQQSSENTTEVPRPMGSEGGDSSAPSSSSSSSGYSVKSLKSKNQDRELIESTFPKHCMISHNADLGEMVSRVYFHSHLHISALKSLTPTIIGVELAVGSKLGPKEGLRELARLYYLRGKIQYEASRSTSTVKFPFVVGSQQLFYAVFVLFDTEAGNAAVDSASYRRQYGCTDMQQPIGHPMGGGDDMDGGVRSDKHGRNYTKVISDPKFLTCKKGKKYCTPSDLLWDAVIWFRRALSLFRCVKDTIGVAKAANYISKCNLEPLFVSCALFRSPFNSASDIGPDTTYDENDEEATMTDDAMKMDNDFYVPNNSMNGMKSPLECMATLDNIRLEAFDRDAHSLPSRSISLDDIQNVMNISLVLCRESFIPMVLLEAYLNASELRILQGESFESIAFWLEARNLFLHLYVDGSVIPLIRKASIMQLRRISKFLDRLVRLLWSCEMSFVNQNILIIDLYVVFSHEFDRAKRSVESRNRVVSKDIDELLQSLCHNKAQSGQNIFPNGSSLPASAGPGTGFTPPLTPQNSATGLSSNTAAPSNNSSSSAPIPPAILGGIFSQNFVDMEHAVLLEKIFDFRKDRENHHSQGAAGDSLSQASTMSMSLRTADESYTRDISQLFPWMKDRFANMHTNENISHSSNAQATDSFSASAPSNGAANASPSEGVLIDDLWRCEALVSFTQSIYQAHKIGLREMIKRIKQILCTQSLSMRRIRLLNRQYSVLDMAFEDIKRPFMSQTAPYYKAFGLGDGNAKKAVIVEDRLKNLVYSCYVDNLLLMYRPYNGSKHIQIIGGSGFVTFQEASQKVLALQQDTSSGFSIGESIKSGSHDGSGSGSADQFDKAMDKQRAAAAAAAPTRMTHGRNDGGTFNQGPGQVLLQIPGFSGGGSRTSSNSWISESCFTNDEVQFLFDLAVEAEENSCYGGLQQRKAIQEKIRHGFLKGALQFLKDVEFDPSIDESSGSASFGELHLPVDDSGKYEAILPSQLLRIFRPQRTEILPPTVAVPVTYIGSKSLNIIPWECLTDIRMIRNLSLLTMFTFAKDRNRAYAGPAWNQTPFYVSFAQGIIGLPARISSDVKNRDTSRRASGAVIGMSNIRQTSHVSKIAKTFLGNPNPLKIKMSEDATHKYQGICEGYQKREWPHPSHLLPFGKTSSQSLRSRRLRKFTFFDLNTMEKSPLYLGQWLEEKSVAPPGSTFIPSTMGNISGGPSLTSNSRFLELNSIFPLIILSFSDLIDLPDAISNVLSTRGDAVCVFTPHFCMGHVAKEIVRSIDTWCVSVPPSASAGSAATAVNAGGGGGNTGLSSSYASLSNVLSGMASGSNMSSGFFSRSNSQSSKGSTTAQFSNILDYDPSETVLNSRTWIYHAVMDAVARVQEENAAPIIVYI